jgi:hypothetical protein
MEWITSETNMCYKTLTIIMKRILKEMIAPAKKLSPRMHLSCKKKICTFNQTEH